jgi:hypothetical protein
MLSPPTRSSRFAAAQQRPTPVKGALRLPNGAHISGGVYQDAGLAGELPLPWSVFTEAKSRHGRPINYSLSAWQVIRRTACLRECAPNKIIDVLSLPDPE